MFTRTCGRGFLAQGESLPSMTTSASIRTYAGLGTNRINKHALEKDLRREPVRAIQLVTCFKALMECESTQRWQIAKAEDGSVRSKRFGLPAHSKLSCASKRYRTADEVLQISQPRDHALKVPDAISVRILERARIDLVEDAGFPPRRTGFVTRGSRTARDSMSVASGP